VAARHAKRSKSEAWRPDAKRPAAALTGTLMIAPSIDDLACVGRHGSAEFVLCAIVAIWSASSQVTLQCDTGSWIKTCLRKCVPHDGRLDPIAQTLHSFRFGAVVAAVERALFLQSVAHDLDAAMGT
jgi:hypothetical protein